MEEEERVRERNYLQSIKSNICYIGEWEKSGFANEPVLSKIFLMSDEFIDESIELKLTIKYVFNVRLNYIVANL